MTNANTQTSFNHYLSFIVHFGHETVNESVVAQEQHNLEKHTQNISYPHLTIYTIQKLQASYSKEKRNFLKHCGYLVFLSHFICSYDGLILPQQQEDADITETNCL